MWVAPGYGLRGKGRKGGVDKEKGACRPEKVIILFWTKGQIVE